MQKMVDTFFEVVIVTLICVSLFSGKPYAGCTVSSPRAAQRALVPASTRPRFFSRASTVGSRPRKAL